MGRMAEDGPIDVRYPLEEIRGGYEARTKKNVEDSDGTVVFYDSELHGGTERTVAFCMQTGKPHRQIDIQKVAVDKAADQVVSFVADYGIGVLNVAGPRLSHCPSIYNYVKSAMGLVIAMITSPSD